MKITLTQPTYRSTIWIYIESSDVCTKISTSSIFNPYERLYIWLGQIRDSQLPASMVIDEEGYGVELIAEKASNEMILFRIDPWMCGNDTATRLATTLKPDELLKAFHNGIAEFIKDGYRPSDWSLIDHLSNINWGALLKPPTIPGQNWQQRLLMSDLGSYDGIIEKSELSEQVTLEQQWSIVLRGVLDRIAILAGSNRKFDIQALANLYRTLPEDIVLGDIDSDWYQERRVALNKKYGLKHYQRTPEEREHHEIIRTIRHKMLRVGQIVDGTVNAIKSYGIFIDIGGYNALIHISAISQIPTPIQQIDMLFKHGDWIRAMIVSIDIERGPVLLSTKDLEVEPGDMLKEPWKVYETAEEMAERYIQNVLSKQDVD